MADMEREIGAQQTGDAESAMDVDSVEEGEISPDEKDNLVTLAVREKVSDQASRSSAPSSNSSRGIKRPTAEDLEGRPMTVSQRFIPPSKRRVFGGVPQRPQRLLINLDDDSDSDDDDTDVGATSRAIEDEAARMLAEKEESIRRLKEQIAARLKARELKRLQAAVAGESSRSGSETPGDKAALAAEQEALRVAEADVAAGEWFRAHASPLNVQLMSLHPNKPLGRMRTLQWTMIMVRYTEFIHRRGSSLRRYSRFRFVCLVHERIADG